MAKVNEPAPNLIVDEWAQGTESNIDRQRGNVVLIEVFQVNCPGCFVGGFPEVIELHRRYKDEGLVVWGLATAFEDFDKNNIENLRRLIAKGELVGETLASLGSLNMSNRGRLTYQIPFPIAWDRIVKSAGEATDDAVEKIILRDIPDFPSIATASQERIRNQVREWLRKKAFDSKTFDAYGLRGTPSTILVDKRGILRYKQFGFGFGIETCVKSLLDE